jgi:hypothetical protein
MLVGYILIRQFIIKALLLRQQFNQFISVSVLALECFSWKNFQTNYSTLLLMNTLKLFIE